MIAIREGLLPRTVGLNEPDPELRVNHADGSRKTACAR